MSPLISSLITVPVEAHTSGAKWRRRCVTQCAFQDGSVQVTPTHKTTNAIYNMKMTKLVIHVIIYHSLCFTLRRLSTFQVRAPVDIHSKVIAAIRFSQCQSKGFYIIFCWITFEQSWFKHILWNEVCFWSMIVKKITIFCEQC